MAMNVLLIGASRGIGLEFVRQYRADHCAVTATARDDAGLNRLRQLGASVLRLDVVDEACVSGLASELKPSWFDVVIICAGAASHLEALEAPTEAAFDSIMHANVLGPMRVIPSVVTALAPGAKVAVLSSRLGSIGGRTQTGMWVYRASKAALNSVLKDVSLALGHRATCVSLHPGWVRTDMGGVAADIDVADSVAGMRKVIASLNSSDTGSFRNYDGESIPW
ncbi:SDR family oxidoreductase [Rhodoferax sediminis]|uniref:SDR family oxidoreductase n=2 Tax=Rhodoferax sediminis TaxID=2509614 RepID=A0A515DAD6_9BURK|nr:SDR family oxidoreductase [Rhodoferax sediminis]